MSCICKVCYHHQVGDAPVSTSKVFFMVLTNTLFLHENSNGEVTMNIEGFITWEPDTKKTSYFQQFSIWVSCISTLGLLFFSQLVLYILRMECIVSWFYLFISAPFGPTYQTSASKHWHTLLTGMINSCKFLQICSNWKLNPGLC